MQKKQKVQEQTDSMPLSEVEKLLFSQRQHYEQSLQVQMMEVRNAPTPSPSELKELQEIDPSFPNRLIEMVEKEQKFRHYSTFFGQSGLIFLVLGGYVIAGLVGIHSQTIGVSIAISISYIAYIFKNKNPKPPKHTPQP